MPKVLVTGATGLLGFNIVQAVLAKGGRVKALVRSIERAKTLLPPSVELFSGDVTKAADVTAASDDCVALYHAAGLPEQWLRNPDLFQRVNVGGTQNVIEACLSHDIKLIYVSTVDVFSARRGELFDETCLAETPKETAYERSKQAADRCVTEALERGLQAVFMHPAALYGPGPLSSPGLNQLIWKVAERKVPAVPPGSIPVVLAADAAIGCVLADEKSAIGERYIISESCVSFRDLVITIAGALGLDTKPVVLPLWVAKTIATVGEALASHTGMPPLLHRGQLQLLQWQAIPSSKKAQRVLGWTPTPLAEGVRQTIAHSLN